MKVVLLWLGVLSLLEMAVWLPGLWRWRRLFAIVLTPLIALASVALVVQQPRLWTATIALLSFYRVFNLLRLFKGRMHEIYLRRVTWRTSYVLIVSQLAVGGFLVAFRWLPFAQVSHWTLLATLQLLLALILLIATMRQRAHLSLATDLPAYSDHDLPTVSVLIPARNETTELETCLSSLVASTYPKLEIIVLDDCSQNSRTPEVIRSFANNGVRFIAGSEPQPVWLAKNMAYERLAEASSGEILLFCGADTQFTPDAIRTLVITMLAKEKTMLSVLPRNQLPASFKSLLIQPLRYSWEISLPRRLFQRPPVLSTCWLIKRTFLKNSGSFKAVSRSIVPESYFARNASVQDGYSFLQSDVVMSAKTLERQTETALRTRYPQLHRRPELVAAVTLAEIGGLVGAYVLFPVSLYRGDLAVAVLSGLAICASSWGYAMVSALTYRQHGVRFWILLPVAVLVDVLLMHYSMYKYEFSEVLWKGRNICIPVMHVVPHVSLTNPPKR